MVSAHVCQLDPRPGATRLTLTCRFTGGAATGGTPTAQQVRQASASHWPRFWSSGGAIDFSQCTDPRAGELARRTLVLSQYLTAIQCAGTLPPQETGLTCNSWYGKFHLEMHWWHAAHFAYWNRTPLLERSLAYYSATRRPPARWQAAGLPGRPVAEDGGSGGATARPTSGRCSFGSSHIRSITPSFATMLTRTPPRWPATARSSLKPPSSWRPTRGWYSARGQFVLGMARDSGSGESSATGDLESPTFELSYWRWALAVAQRWRQRLGLAPQPEWERVRTMLAPLPHREGVYLAHENCPQDLYATQPRSSLYAGRPGSVAG